MSVTYGFTATLTAKPGMGDRLVDLLLSGMAEGNPAASEHCIVYLVSRSASDPDVAHVTAPGQGVRVHRLRADRRKGVPMIATRQTPGPDDKRR
jgi:hypothetical protein